MKIKMLCVISVVFIVLALSSCGAAKHTYDAKDLFNPCYSGNEIYPYADSSKLDKIAKECTDDDTSYISLSGLLTSCKFTIDPSDGLSNGDTIHVTFTYNKDALKKYGISFDDTSFDYVVQNNQVTLSKTNAETSKNTDNEEITTTLTTEDTDDDIVHIVTKETEDHEINKQESETTQVDIDGKTPIDVFKNFKFECMGNSPEITCIVGINNMDDPTMIRNTLFVCSCGDKQDNYILEHLSEGDVVTVTVVVEQKWLDENNYYIVDYDKDFVCYEE